MAKSNKKTTQNKPDFVLVFSTFGRAVSFCDELSKQSPDVKSIYNGCTVKLWAPAHDFDTILKLSCEPRFQRTAFSQHTASR